MPITIRIAMFNLENPDDKPEQGATRNERIGLMRPTSFGSRAISCVTRRSKARRIPAISVIC
jgi:hypothetical protein